VSIVLEDVRIDGVGAGPPVFDGLSLHIEDKTRIGILGANRATNTNLLRLICGTKRVDHGTARCDVRVSWPIPLSTFLVTGHTLARNVRFIARLYGIDEEEFPRRIVEMVDMTELLNTPLDKCPKFARARLAFALGVGMDFDTYLFDGSFAPADKPFKEKAAEISAARTAGRGVILAATVPTEVEKNCESVYVLEGGRATFFEETSEGVEHFKKLLAAEKKKEKAGEAKATEDEDEDETLSDLNIHTAALADIVD